MSRNTAVVQVAGAGTALVNAERLLSVVKEMTDEAVSLESDGDHLLVSGRRAKFRLLSMKPADFPPFPAAPEAAFTMKAGDLRRMAGQTAFAAARENTTFGRAGVLFRTRAGVLELVATDTRRLARSTCPVESAGESAALVPSSMARMIGPMLADAGPDDPVSVALGRGATAALLTHRV